VQVSLHELKHHIDVLEVPGAGWQHDVLDLHNVCDNSSQHVSTALNTLSSATWARQAVLVVLVAGVDIVCPVPLVGAPP